MSTRSSKRKPDQLNSITRAESIELLVTHGIDLHAQRLYLTGDVNESMTARCQHGLAILNQMRPKKITIVLTTDGGCVYEAFAMHDMIKSNKHPVDIHALGYCMSAGPVILQAGRKRTAAPNTQLMIHAGSESISGEVSTVRKAREHLEAMGERMFSILAARANVLSNEIQVYLDQTTYFSADEAETVGLIDEVISVD